ncbi:hypothetical protein K6119_09790 [Paracrocinitomix mangrovi]|uniref:hypothetical protein n=1 Tax=Paracrocinitomix mangrovi TaxID=2862509 RepID=UPI001C8E01C9|nr:hypothetical protein [Paracrocinitomix mangrovi]UKN03781.1 hypothetical protein K6119_09790 [Paracrocinitomix mangrovi]
MKFINLSTGLFLVYMFSYKIMELMNYQNLKEFLIEHPELQEEFSPIDNSITEYPILMIWTLIFGLILLIWIWTQIKKRARLKLILAGITLLLGIILHFTDNIDYSASTPMSIGGEPITD